MYKITIYVSLSLPTQVESISISHPDDQSSCNSEDVGSNLSVPDVVTSCVSTSAPLPRSKVYIASASRPNLETIVEAIRHLEGKIDQRSFPIRSEALYHTQLLIQHH